MAAKKRATKKRAARKRPGPPPGRKSPYPTATQLECLKAFSKLARELGRNPTIREVSTEMGLVATGSLELLKQLTLKGLLEPEMELTVVGRKLSPLGRRWLKLAV